MGAYHNKDVKIWRPWVTSSDFALTSLVRSRFACDCRFASEHYRWVQNQRPSCAVREFKIINISQQAKLKTDFKLEDVPCCHSMVNGACRRSPWQAHAQSRGVCSIVDVLYSNKNNNKDSLSAFSVHGPVPWYNIVYLIKHSNPNFISIRKKKQ